MDPYSQSTFRRVKVTHSKGCFWAVEHPVSSSRKFGEAYVAEGLEVYEQRSQERLVKGMMKTAKRLGYELVPK